MPENYKQAAKSWAHRSVAYDAEIKRLRDALLQIKLRAISYSTGFPVVNACERLAKMAHDALNDYGDES